MIYLDTSALVPVFMFDSHSDAVRDYLPRAPDPIVTSSFALAEFASAVAIRVRARVLSFDESDDVFGALAEWTARHLDVLDLQAEDYGRAATLVRRFELRLRAPDALHVAICERLGCALMTFDRQQRLAAQSVGVGCVSF